MPREPTTREEHVSEGGEKRGGLALENWIGKRVILNLHRGPAAAEDEDTVEIPGVLEGVDSMGIILLFYADDVRGKGGRRGMVPPDFPPGLVFFPWRRVEFVQLTPFTP
jgi:hypothetical protein